MMESTLTSDERSLEAQALDLLASLARIGVTLQCSAHDGRTADMPSLLEERQRHLQALHALVQKGLRLDEGAVARQWGGVMKQDEVTERAMMDALARFAASLKTVRKKRQTASVYTHRGEPRPVRYCDLHG